jgi:hypothetical protein
MAGLLFVSGFIPRTNETGSLRQDSREEVESPLADEDVEKAGSVMPL